MKQVGTSPHSDHLENSKTQYVEHTTLGNLQHYLWPHTGFGLNAIKDIYIFLYDLEADMKQLGLLDLLILVKQLNQCALSLNKMVL